MVAANKKFVDYRDIAADYSAYSVEAVTDWQLGLLPVYQHLIPCAGKKILDYGCGNGRFTRFLRDQDAEVIGVDISKDLVQIAHNNTPDGIEYRKIASGEIPFVPTESMDASTMSFVLCTVNIREEKLKILREIYRTLKHGGVLVLLSVNWEMAQGKEFISFKLPAVAKLVPGTLLRVELKQPGKTITVEEYFWPIKHYCSLLMESGFEITEIEQPIVSPDDHSHNWLDETRSTPFSVIVARKP